MELVLPRNGVDVELIANLQRRIAGGSNNLTDGFQFAYKALVDAMVNQDSKMISMFCEPELSERFLDFFDTL